MKTLTVADRVKASFRSTAVRVLAGSSIAIATMGSAMAADEPLDLSAGGTLLKSYAEQAATWGTPVLLAIVGIAIIKKVLKMVAK